MRVSRVLSVGLVALLLATTMAMTASASPALLAGPCSNQTAGTYDPACDVDHNGQINILDIQLTAGHWGETGTYTSDNDHEHLGQIWGSSRVPLKIQGNFDGTAGSLPAALVLANTRTLGLGYGLWVDSASGNGVHVNAVGSDGVYVCTTGSATGCVASDENNGVEVGNAEDNGIFVKEAGNDGVVVSSADDDGVYVNTANDDGLNVGSVGGDGLQVAFANGGHGVNVLSASLAGLFVDSAGDDGVHVADAGDHGVYVGTTTDAGLYINASGTYGVYVNNAGGDGVNVNSAVGHGVVGRTNTLANYGGRFSNGAGGGAALYAIGGGNDAADLVLGGTTTTNGDDGRIYSQPDSTSSDILMFSNDYFQVHLDEDNNSTSAFVIYNGANTPVWSISESGLAVADQGSAAAVDAGGDDKQLIYAVHSPQNWLEDFGSGQLVAGEAVVTLDGTFAKVVNLDAPYHVFLTPLGDCSLYVADKDATSFTVRALGRQACAVGFDYRIVALRQGYEAVRMPAYAPAADD